MSETEHTDGGDDPVDDADTGRTVTLWTRRPVCGPRTTAIDRLGDLRTRGVVTDFAVETWPEEVPVGRDRDSDVLERVDRFEEWAAARGLTLRPPFETRTASSLVGGSEEVLVTPMVLAAVYEGGDLVGVYPCADGDDTWTVEAFLDALDPHADDPDETPPLPDPLTP